MMTIALDASRVARGPIERWLTTPLSTAPHPLGLFRFVYCIFYLWYLSSQRCAMLAGLPDDSRHLIYVISWFPFHISPIVFQAMESIVVALVALLLFGWQTRRVTAALFVFGSLLEAVLTVGDKEHGPVFLTFFIPLFMLLAGAPWGDAYSIDSARRGRPARADDELLARHALPARAILVILATLFVSAALLKVIGQGIWLRDTKLMSNFGLYHNVEGALLGLPATRLAVYMKQWPILHYAMQFGVLLFEGTFFLALVNRQLLRLYIGLALVFQSVNGLFFVVTFAPLLIAYALFVDWKILRRRWLPRVTWQTRSTRPLIALAVALAIILASTWNIGTLTRSIFSLGGAINWRSIFWPMLPIGIWLVITAAWQILRSLASRPNTAQITPHVPASR